MFVHLHEKRRFGARSDRVGWIVEPNGCHVWQGGKDKDGYGGVTINKRYRRVVRYRYEREIGPIPDGMCLDHYVCDNKSCVNPLHVRPVTPRENALRANGGIAVRGASTTHCPKGHKHGPDNTFPSWQKAGVRACRTCALEQAKSRRIATARPL